MDLDLERILALTQRGQWSIDELDWSQPLSDYEVIGEQARQEAGWALLFTAGLERQAAYVFDVCSRYVDDPVAKQIYQLFRGEELRHAEAEERLAARYGVKWADVPWGARAMIEWADHSNGKEDPRRVFEFASAYILLFELALDTLLMPALKKLSQDPVQADVFRRIDSDESRHLAMDYWLLERRGSEQRGKTMDQVLETSFGPATAGQRLRTRMKLAGFLGSLFLGFGSLAVRVKALRGVLLDPASVEKYLELVSRVPKKAPHAMDVPAYRIGLSGQRRVLQLLGWLQARTSAGARSAA